MEETKKIDQRAAQMHIVSIVIGLVAFGFIQTTEDYTLLGTGFLLNIVWFIAGNLWVEKWRDKKMLQHYAAIKLPLFEVQQSKDDTLVWKRAEAHRKLLMKANNLLYIDAKIKVEEVYMNDPAIRFTEPTEEYWDRVEDYKRDYLDDWAKKIAPSDENWRKVHLHNQDMELDEKKFRFPFRLRNLAK